jgi:hypothetical protein
MHKITRRRIATVAVAALFAGGLACKREQTAKEEANANLPPLSVIAVAQPRAASQLVDGFWSVENNAWRWTKHNFAVLLAVPPGAAQNGATLELRFAVTDGLIARRLSVTLSSSVGTVALPPETYREAGTYVYKRDVPAAAFAAGSPVKVSFSTDNYLRAGEIEGRELALVVRGVGLVAK